MVKGLLWHWLHLCVHGRIIWLLKADIMVQVHINCRIVLKELSWQLLAEGVVATI